MNSERPELSRLERALDHALAVQRPTVQRWIARDRRRHPGEAPSATCRRLERQYLATVTGTGTATGATAAAPGVGTGVALALAAGDFAATLDAAVLLALAVAEVHGVQVDDVERRRTLVLAILLGESGPPVVARAAERIGKHWAKNAINAIPMAQINRINKVLGPRFVTKYGTQQGILVLGKAVPFGIGAGLGGAGNAVVGYSVVRGVRRAFGPPPEDWSDGGSARKPDDDDKDDGALLEVLNAEVIDVRPS